MEFELEAFFSRRRSGIVVKVIHHSGNHSTHHPADTGQEYGVATAIRRIKGTYHDYHCFPDERQTNVSNRSASAA